MIIIMKMKTYCYNCGKQVVYGSHGKPKFCMHCGSDLNSTKESTASEQETEGAFAEEELITEIPSIDGLDFTYDQPPQRKVTLSEIAGTKDPGHGQVEMERPRYESTKEAMEEYRREAGQLRNKDA